MNWHSSSRDMSGRQSSELYSCGVKAVRQCGQRGCQLSSERHGQCVQGSYIEPLCIQSQGIDA